MARDSAVTNVTHYQQLAVCVLGLVMVSVRVRFMVMVRVTGKACPVSVPWLSSR